MIYPLSPFGFSAFNSIAGKSLPNELSVSRFKTYRDPSRTYVSPSPPDGRRAV